MREGQITVAWNVCYQSNLHIFLIFDKGSLLG
jgi:hypothetical protein